MATKVPGKVRGLSQFYVGGLERTEIWVNKKQADCLPFVEGKRVDIELLISSHRYRAGLRSTSPNPYVWICPDVKDQYGSRTNLAQVLKQYLTAYRHGYSSEFAMEQKSRSEIIGDAESLISRAFKWLVLIQRAS
jgi:hypothetical protein